MRERKREGGSEREREREREREKDWLCLLNKRENDIDKMLETIIICKCE